MLRTLKKEKVIYTYSLMSAHTVRVVFEREKAKHIQAILEFSEVQENPVTHKRSYKSYEKNE